MIAFYRFTFPDMQGGEFEVVLTAREYIRCMFIATRKSTRTHFIVYIHTHSHTCTYTHTRTCKRTSHLLKRKYNCRGTHAHTHTQTHIHTHAYSHVLAQAHTQARTITHAHTRERAHTRARARASKHARRNVHYAICTCARRHLYMSTLTPLYYIFSLTFPL